MTPSIVPTTENGTVTAATGGTAITNVASNDMVNGHPATLGAGGNSSVSQSGVWSIGITLNPATGAISVAAGTTPGTYSVTYQLCDKLIPQNCATIVDNINVTSSVVPTAESGTVPSVTGGTAITNVASNDLINGNPAILGAGGNATVSQSGVWPAGIVLNPATGEVTVAAGTTPGVYPVTYQLCDNSTPPNCATVEDTVFVTGSVSSGGTGGLESKSLGALIGTRNYNIIKKGANGAVTYSASELISSKKGSASTFGINSTSSLASIMPYRVDASYQQYDKTAAVIDLETFTNAIDIRAVDFTKYQVTQAVAFATKTVGGVYSHTKPICDRLKGAELLKVETVQIQSINFVRYTLKQADASIEYAISFSAGIKAGRSTYSIQSNWMTQDYIGEDTLVNYQLWAASTANVTTMVNEVLSRLKANMPVQQVANVNDLPTIYVSKGTRNGTSLIFSINNNTNYTTGYFELTSRNTENAKVGNVTVVPFTIAANNKSAVTIPVSDTYDADVKLYINNGVQDLVYMADGIWGTSFNKSTTSIAQFNVLNDNNRQYNADEYSLLRNVQVQATSPDYVSVYKFLKGGGAAQNLNGYKSIKFTTGINTGGLNLRVTITKQSIAGWNKQYSYLVSGVEDGKLYQVGLSDFKSADANAATIDASDVTSIVFSVEVPSGQATSFTASLTNVSFSKEDIIYERTLELKSVNVSPNPNTGTFKVSFESPKDVQLKLSIIDVAGKVIKTSIVNATRGKNEVSVSLNQGVKNNMFIVKLEGSDFKYSTQKVLIQNK